MFDGPIIIDSEFYYIYRGGGNGNVSRLDIINFFNLIKMDIFENSEKVKNYVKMELSNDDEVLKVHMTYVDMLNYIKQRINWLLIENFKDDYAKWPIIRLTFNYKV